jgi:hypothetical protein
MGRSSDAEGFWEYPPLPWGFYPILAIGVRAACFD